MKYILKSVLCYIILMLCVVSISEAQDMKNWFKEDPQINKYAGISSDLAIEKLLKGKKSTTVVVAVIDGGTDIHHPDLKDNIWVNQNEIPGNGIDDDKNGYVDDINGWNFIGGPDGNVIYDNMEEVRIYNSLKLKYENKSQSGLSAVQKEEYKLFNEVKQKIDAELKDAQSGYKLFSKWKKYIDKVKSELEHLEINAANLSKIKSDDKEFNEWKTSIATVLQGGTSFDQISSIFLDGYKYSDTMINYHFNVNFDSRSLVNDDYSNPNEKYYGNNDVKGPDSEHGTHVAGIIGAVRNNDMGINGIAPDVKIMVVRAVPDGDERNKDVANAIRYAADNGAKIINMSFGKNYSPFKNIVDEAVKYAASKDVLLVHAAGNENMNIDKVNNFPTPFYSGSGLPEPSWIEVGAISSSGDIADFSNYGFKTVDVLAPGKSIYSTMPDDAYDFQDGTSMAAPVVSGMAALIRSYYPQLNSVQVKEVIINSVIKPNIKTVVPGKKKKKIKFKKLCSSGGFVNTYRAILIADKM